MARDSLLADRPKVEAPAKEGSNSLIASAARVGKGGVSWNKIARGESDAWQRAAWNFYHTIGEFRYACDWVGSMLSKALIHASKMDENGRSVPVTEGPAFQYISELFGDADGRAEMLRLIGIHMSVTGECWLVGYPLVEETDEGVVIVEEDHWEVVAATELRNSGSKKNPVWSISGVRVNTQDHSDVMAIRVWRPDPERPQFAISPARAILSTLGELSKLSDHVSAQIDSRLAGAGILLMPTEMQFPPKKVVEGEEVKTANTAKDLMELIQEAMATAIEDRSDPSAIVPIVITAPADAIDKVKHLTFWSGLDEKAIELRNEAIRRLALGMDMPPEVLQGVGEANHWNAWQADESGIKAHTEPLLKIITTAIGIGFLRPLLASTPGIGDKERITDYSVAADTSEMRLRPNRSKEALELFNLGLLSPEALLRETGFDWTRDKPSDQQAQDWYMRKIASGSTTPEQVEAALKILFPTLELRTAQPAIEGEVGQEARPTPSLKDHPVRDIPDQAVSERRKEAREAGRVPSAASIIGAEQIVLRALERAGNRMRNRMGGRMEGVSAADTYLTFAAKSDQLGDYLEDAFGDNVSALALRTGMETGKLRSILDGYCRVLLMSQRPHSYEALENHFGLALSKELVSA